MAQVNSSQSRFVAFLMAGALALTIAAPSSAIMIGQIDDFQDGTTQGWRIGFDDEPFPRAVADAGPAGMGDFALQMATSHSGLDGATRPLLITFENQRWIGDWMAAGVTQIEMDVRNPTTSALTMRLGIAGPGGFGFGAGDVFVTNGISVPPDNDWHQITFDVLAPDWVSVGGDDIDVALSDVTHFRVLHNPFPDFIGGNGEQFFLDNIHAVGASLVLAGDYNGNGIVDAADYTVWRDLLGQTGESLAADGTGPGGVPDGVVDQLDYDLWKTSFGNSLNGHANNPGLGVSAAAVPEPTSCLLLLAAAAGVSLYRRGRAAN